MRLLSFLSHVETTLAMLNPEQPAGWKRRANYQAGLSTLWLPELGLALSLQCCSLGENKFSLRTRWSGPTGAILYERLFFCGPSPFDWSTAAEAVAEAMPAPSPEGNAAPDELKSKAIA
jgi:hypothetical protein